MAYTEMRCAVYIIHTVLAPKGYLFRDLVNVLEHSILLLSKTFFTEATDMRS